MVTLLSKSNTNVDYKRFKTSKDVMAKNGARSNYEKKLCEKIATFDSCFFRLKKKPHKSISMQNHMVEQKSSINQHHVKFSFLG